MLIYAVAMELKGDGELSGLQLADAACLFVYF